MRYLPANNNCQVHLKSNCRNECDLSLVLHKSMFYAIEVVNDFDLYLTFVNFELWWAVAWVSKLKCWVCPLSPTCSISLAAAAGTEHFGLRGNSHQWIIYKNFGSLPLAKIQQFCREGLEKTRKLAIFNRILTSNSFFQIILYTRANSIPKIWVLSVNVTYIQ